LAAAFRAGVEDDDADKGTTGFQCGSALAPDTLPAQRGRCTVPSLSPSCEDGTEDDAFLDAVATFGACPDNEFVCAGLVRTRNPPSSGMTPTYSHAHVHTHIHSHIFTHMFTLTHTPHTHTRTYT